MVQAFVNKNNPDINFVKFANEEIRNQYYINCLMPNYGMGFSNNHTGRSIPTFIYNDLETHSFNKQIVSVSYIAALNLLCKYYTDICTDFSVNRYSNGYLESLFSIVNSYFNGISSRVLKISFMHEYQSLNLDTYKEVYKKNYKDLKKQIISKSCSIFLDSVYYLYNVIGRDLPNKILQTNLKDIFGTEFKLRQILEANKGKIIYIDFWASWCIPCINEIPASLMLSKDYEDKGVVFIYLSLDETGSNESWKKRAEELGIEKNQYIVENNFEAELSKYINVGALPLYCIINKEGALVTRSAPRPSSDRIRKLFDKLLQ